VNYIIYNGMGYDIFTFLMYLPVYSINFHRLKENKMHYDLAVIVDEVLNLLKKYSYTK